MSRAVHDKSRPVLEIAGLRVLLEGTLALEDISFTLARGDSVAVVGPNGAGKSTLFRAIAGTIEYQSGQDHGLRKHP